MLRSVKAQAAEREECERGWKQHLADAEEKVESGDVN